MRRFHFIGFGLLLLWLLAPRGGRVWAQADDGLREEVLRALKKSVTYYREKVARHGGYVYYTSLDLKERWGEGKVDEDTIVVQPPGTPTVGMAYLRAFEATGDRYYLDAAREAAGAMVYGQLESGGWTQIIHFGPAKRLGKYRNGKGGDWNASSLDDGQTQSALQFLAKVDAALKFEDAAIHEAALYGFNALLRAQFPNGGFPQVWTGPVRPLPVVRASYPDYEWKTEGKVKNYWDQYTLNDGLAGTVADTLIVAHQVYNDPRYRAALEKLGDFLLLAQMPDPQPAWCQQYDPAMHPIWARKFEPPAVSGWESQDAMQTLITISRYTGKPRYLEPIPRALAYLRRSLLPDGRLARFYELKTNRPLYMDAAYRLTYDDGDAPGHYGWEQTSKLVNIERAYDDAETVIEPPSSRTLVDLEGFVRRIIKKLDMYGRWISIYNGARLLGQPKFGKGCRYISSDEFCECTKNLSEYLYVNNSIIRQH